jgi:ERCC4-related helicase
VFWRRRGRCRVLVVVPRRVLAYNPWEKEIERWMPDLKPKCLILSGFMPPRERMLALSSFHVDFLLMTAIALNNDYILGRIKLNSFDMVIFDEAHRVVAFGEELGQYRYSVRHKQLALNLIASKEIVVLGLTIPETERTFDTERLLTAISVASDTAKAPKTETYVVRLESAHATKVDLWFRAQMWRAMNNLRKVLGRKIPWRINEARLLEVLEEKELPGMKYGRYVTALRRYRYLYQSSQAGYVGGGGVEEYLRGGRQIVGTLPL